MKTLFVILALCCTNCAITQKVHDYEPCGKVTFIDAYGFEITLIDRNHDRDAELFFMSNRPDTVKMNQVFCLTHNHKTKR